MHSRRRWWSAVVVVAALVVSPAASPGAVSSGVVAAKPDGAVLGPTQLLIAAVGRKLDHLQADIATSPLTGVARRRLEARLFDVRTDIAALGDPRDPTESARVRVLRQRLDRLVRLLQDRPV
jgi:hypothetical protein